MAMNPTNKEIFCFVFIYFFLFKLVFIAAATGTYGKIIKL